MEPKSPTVEELGDEYKRARESGSASEVRAAALDYCRARVEQGATQAEVALELGLKRWTLSKWHQRREGVRPWAERGDGVQPRSAAGNEECGVLKREIEGLGPRTPSRRFPEALKGRIVEWVRAERARGMGAKEIAEELGVPWESLSKWMEAPEGEAAASRVRAVRVVGGGAAWVRGTVGGPVLRSPGGYVVEGLDLASVAELLRRLG